MSEWIDVRQRLPESGRLCLVYGGGVVQHSLYSMDDESGDWNPFDDDFDSAPFNTFTHWMSLPDPPETKP